MKCKRGNRGCDDLRLKNTVPFRPIWDILAYLGYGHTVPFGTGILAENDIGSHK